MTEILGKTFQLIILQLNQDAIIVQKYFEALLAI
jgi:hypothetical protein